MLKALTTDQNRIPEGVLLRDLDFEEPFYEGLIYNPPARGVWNIVHTGMLIPESHQIYVCAQGCLRGVVLTAAEMNRMENMSWVSLREQDMWNGEMESRVIEGSRDFVEIMRSYAREQRLDIPLRALGPSPCTLGRINNRYRYRIIIKCRVSRKLRDMIRYCLESFMKLPKYSEVRISADINGDIGL